MGPLFFPLAVSASSRQTKQQLRYIYGSCVDESHPQARLLPGSFSNFFLCHGWVNRLPPPPSYVTGLRGMYHGSPRYVCITGLHDKYHGSSSDHREVYISRAFGVITVSLLNWRVGRSPQRPRASFRFHDASQCRTLRGSVRCMPDCRGLLMLPRSPATNSSSLCCCFFAAACFCFLDVL